MIVNFGAKLFFRGILHRKLTLMGLGQDVNNQKKELGEMALGAGQSYTDKNGTKVIQGALTRKQENWLGENRNKPIDGRTTELLPLTPAQKLYLALCKNGMQLQEALESCCLNETQKAPAQQALNILDANGAQQNINEADIVTKITRPTFVGANLNRYDLWNAQMQGANLWGAGLQEADLSWAHLRDAQMQGADLKKAWLCHANLRGAQLQGADLKKAGLLGADISGANFQDAKNLKDAYLKLAFYCQDNPPKNLEDALEGVDAEQRPMALTKQEYDKVCRLRDSNNLSAFTAELNRLRDVCDTRIDSQQQVDAAVNAAKAKFAWCPTTVAIMFSQGFDAQTRAAWYGNGAGGNVLQGISNRLEGLNNHLVGRGSR
jgi:uncharacterized protein YjbI with pentapeptide repeats